VTRIQPLCSALNLNVHCHMILPDGAASAQGALGALADDRAVDIVFSDVLMPGAMNGMDLAREVRRRRTHMPILLTTGYSEAAFKEAASEQINVSRKPYEIHALDSALRVALATFAAS
jgi:DNA-binding NtrC family response regulator